MLSGLALDHFVIVLFAFVVLGLISLVLCQEIGCAERLQNDLFLCRMGRKTLPQSTYGVNGVSRV